MGLVRLFYFLQHTRTTSSGIRNPNSRAANGTGILGSWEGYMLHLSHESPVSTPSQIPRLELGTQFW